MALGFTGKIIKRQKVSKASSSEGRVNRKFENVEPTQFRLAYFSINGSQYRSHMHFSPDAQPWLNFIESGDELSLVYQKSFLGMFDNRVISYINHTKSEEIQNCQTGLFTLVILFALNFMALANLKMTTNPSSIDYIVAVIFTLIFFSQFIRFLFRDTLYNNFISSFKKNNPEKMEVKRATGKTKFEVINEYSHKLKGQPDILAESSQERFLEKEWNKQGSVAEVVDPLESIRTIQEPSTNYLEDRSFKGLISIKDENLWKIVLKSKIVAMVILDEKFIYSGYTLYSGEVIINPELSRKDIEKGKVIHSRSSSSRRNSDPIFAEQAGGLYVGWTVQGNNKSKRKR